MNQKNQLGQLQFALSALNAFVSVGNKGSLLTRQWKEKFTQDLSQIISAVHLPDCDVEGTVRKLNQMIDNLNYQLSSATPYSPYPPFDTEEKKQVGYSVIAFQNYIHQELLAETLSLQEEKALFQQATTLWGETIWPRLSPHEAIVKLSKLIERTNHSGIPRIYPLPDAQFYSF